MCGVQHPEHPELACERTLCVEYHRNGLVTWPSDQRMPSKREDPVLLAGIVERTRARQRGTT